VGEPGCSEPNIVVVKLGGSVLTGVKAFLSATPRSTSPWKRAARNTSKSFRARSEKPDTCSSAWCDAQSFS
jgi:hypothetical protein